MIPQPHLRTAEQPAQGLGASVSGGEVAMVNSEAKVGTYSAAGLGSKYDLAPVPSR